MKQTPSIDGAPGPVRHKGLETLEERGAKVCWDLTDWRTPAGAYPRGHRDHNALRELAKQ